MNLNKICLILKLIEINFGSCDRLNLIFWKFDNRYVLNWMRINFGVEEVLEIKFGKMDLEIVQFCYTRELCGLKIR